MKVTAKKILLVIIFIAIAVLGCNLYIQYKMNTYGREKCKKGASGYETIYDDKNGICVFHVYDSQFNEETAKYNCEHQVGGITAPGTYPEYKFENGKCVMHEIGNM